MEEKIITARINKRLFEKMKKYNEVNWSSVIRNALINRIWHEETENFEIDKEKADKAMESIDRIRQSKVFDSGKSSVEIIREWRDRRK